jgi:hypothetical protein
MVTCSDSLRSLQASFKRSIAFGSSAGFVLRAAGLLRVEGIRESCRTQTFC